MPFGVDSEQPFFLEIGVDAFREDLGDLSYPFGIVRAFNVFDFNF